MATTGAAMNNKNMALMERQRLTIPDAPPDTSDDETLEHVHTLMRICPRYKRAMEELIAEHLILKGEGVAINLGLTFPPEEE